MTLQISVCCDSSLYPYCFLDLFVFWSSSTPARCITIPTKGCPSISLIQGTRQYQANVDVERIRKMYVFRAQQLKSRYTIYKCMSQTMANGGERNTIRLKRGLVSATTERPHVWKTIVRQPQRGVEQVGTEEIFPSQAPFILALVASTWRFWCASLPAREP